VEIVLVMQDGDPDRIPWRAKKHADIYCDGRLQEWFGE
jgi:hypothetical protein